MSVAASSSTGASSGTASRSTEKKLAHFRPVIERRGLALPDRHDLGDPAANTLDRRGRQRSPQGVVGGYQSPQQIPLLTGKLTGTFAETGHPPRFSRLIKHADPIGYSRIPYATEQRISKRVSGNFFKEQGNLVKLSNCSETADGRSATSVVAEAANDLFSCWNFDFQYCYGRSR